MKFKCIPKCSYQCSDQQFKKKANYPVEEIRFNKEDERINP